MVKKLSRILPHLLVASALIFPAYALAESQGGFVPLAPVTTKSGDLYGSTGDLSTFLNNLFKFAIAIGAIGAVLRLAYAGYLYMGSDMWTQKGKAKEVIRDVTLGLILLLAVWLILYQINPDILSLQALKNIKPVQQGQQTSGNTSIGGSKDLNCTGSNNSFCMNGTVVTPVRTPSYSELMGNALGEGASQDTSQTSVTTVTPAGSPDPNGLGPTPGIPF